MEETNLVVEEKEKLNDAVDAIDAVEEKVLEEVENEEASPVKKRNLIKNYFLINKKVKQERNFMAELEKFWKDLVVEEKLLPELQSKGFNMLIHFAKMQYALLDSERA